MIESGTKQEKSRICDDKATTSWSRLKDPRIVRVSRTFGGKDRHSKVCTVRGLRDRRVRLSVPTAIQLYDLQDRLGLNQPSKVVDWLLNVAKQEIDGLPPLQFPILTPNHTFLPAKQAAAGLKISADFNWNDPSTKPPSRVFSNDPAYNNNNNNNNNTPSFSSLLSSSAMAAWDPSSCLTLSQPPISLQTTPQQQDFSQLLVYQPYFTSPAFQNSDSSVRPPFRFSMTADLLPSQNNDQNKHDDVHSS